MAELKSMDLFKITLIVMIFFSFSITIISHNLPSDSQHYVDIYESFTNNYDMYNISREVEDGLDQQTKVPILDIGALVFYSGNIVLDLLLNFAFAIPEMVGLLIYGITEVFNLDGSVIILVQSFATISIMVLYFIGLISLITGIRSGRVV